MTHPITGAEFDSPAPPGAGWPGDPATSTTPVAVTAADVAELAATATELAQIDATVSVCRACPRLVAWREEVAATKRRSFAAEPYWGRAVPSFGDDQPHVLIVGLAPAAHGANRTGRMFTGDRSGEWLYRALHRAGYANQSQSDHAGDGLQLTGVRIVPALHCAPPANKPTGAELATCASWFEAELVLCQPHLRSILVLGQIAWTTLFAAMRRMGWQLDQAKFGHGVAVSVRPPQGEAIKVVGSYHVSQQNTFTGRLTEQMLDEAIAALTIS